MQSLDNCPKCGSGAYSLANVCGVPDEHDKTDHLGEFYICDGCHHQWRPPEAPDDDKQMTPYPWHKT